VRNSVCDDYEKKAVFQKMSGTEDFQRLKQQALENASDLFDEIVERALGDTPIEKQLFAALQVRAWLGASEYTRIELVKNEEREKSLLQYLSTARHWSNPDLPTETAITTLLVRPQAQLEDWRVDFLIHALDWRDRRKLKWRRLIVECDGHDFHERTKEQAKRDRSRDRTAHLEGYDCFRFTGSEIWKDPWGCAEHITDWATKGWG
jgi:very-short-patch-repair endonuclease